MFQERPERGPEPRGPQLVTSRRVRLWFLVVCTSLLLGSGITFRARAEFTARCLGNNNAFSAWWCTFSALPELPANYRTVAISWAHDDGVAYAGSVLMLVAREMTPVLRVRLRPLTDWKGKRRAARAYLWTAATAMGCDAARKVAPAVAGKLTPWLVVGPATYQVGSKFVGARAVMGRHCGGTLDTFLLRIDDTRVELERASTRLADAAETSLAAAADAAVEVIGAATETATTASGSMWRRLIAVFDF